MSIPILQILQIGVYRLRFDFLPLKFNNPVCAMGVKNTMSMHALNIDFIGDVSAGMICVSFIETAGPKKNLFVINVMMMPSLRIL